MGVRPFSNSQNLGSVPSVPELPLWKSQVRPGVGLAALHPQFARRTIQNLQSRSFLYHPIQGVVGQCLASLSIGGGYCVGEHLLAELPGREPCQDVFNCVSALLQRVVALNARRGAVDELIGVAGAVVDCDGSAQARLAFAVPTSRLVIFSSLHNRETHTT